jgi:predicted ATPase/DNA-binding CsgD family transcriptional regulator
MQSETVTPIARQDKAVQHHLPIQPTPLVGRQQEVDTALQLLRRADVHLLTFTGAPGVGKTRLALQVGMDLINDFVDGVCFVSLASIRHADLLIPTLAHLMGLSEDGNQPLLDLLKAYLERKRLLLLLDNFEQILSAAPLLADLLASCPDLKLLVTSRESLHLRAEQRFPVPPLALPDPAHLPDTLALTQCGSVALFVQRAQAVQPNFALTPAIAPAIALICRRLDGLPLAIELAAAHITLFSPQDLAARLQHRLQVLTQGPSDLPVRQQTLHNTLAWSYALLSEDDQRLLRQLAVFEGDCTLPAVEVVCAPPGNGGTLVVHAAASLIDKSLLQSIEQPGKEARLRLLETIREYGLERLTESGELEITRQAHATYYLTLAEKTELRLGGPEQVAVLEQLGQEYANLRAAMQWSLEPDETGHRKEIAVRLGGALRWFWLVRGPVSEGRTFLARALENSAGVAEEARAKALDAAARLAGIQGDAEQKEALGKASLALYRQLDNPLGLAHALYLCEGESQDWGGKAQLRGKLTVSRAYTEEALALFKAAGFEDGAAWSLYRLALLTDLQGDDAGARAQMEAVLALQKRLQNKRGISAALFALAEMRFAAQSDPATIRPLLEESLALGRELGDQEDIASSLCLLGELALSQADAATARALVEESLAHCQEMGHRYGLAQSRSALAGVEAWVGNYAAAAGLYESSLRDYDTLKDSEGMARCLEGLASVAAAQGSPVGAARLWGAAEALREVSCVPVLSVWRAPYEAEVAAARNRLDEQTFVTAWAEGRATTLEQTLTARQLLTHLQKTLPEFPFSGEKPALPRRVIAQKFGGLTEREREVAALLAQGKSNREIAKVLVVHYRTIETHVSNILSKLGCTSRVQIAVWARDKGLGTQAFK